MSVKEQADLFEDKVFAYVQRYVASGESFLNPKWCQFFQKKRYYSKDRHSEIEVDISVESYSEGATDWSVLLVVECKNYSHSVPVDDVEEFVAKLDQIAGKNVKGAIFSPANFQSGALTYANSKGIALVRMLPENQIEWILRRTPAPVILDQRKEYRESQIVDALTNPNYVGQSEFLFGCTATVRSTSLTEILNTLLKGLASEHSSEVAKEPPLRETTEIDPRPDVPFLGQEELETRTARIIDYFQRGGESRKEVDLKKICDYIADRHKVAFLFDQNLGFDAAGREILGKLAVNPMQIHVSRTLKENSHRWRFTVAHEIGHFVLHRNLNLSLIIGTHLETERTQSPTILDDEPNVHGRLEWQANTFASCLLMRSDPVFKVVVNHLKAQEVNNFGHGIVFVDGQACNWRPFLQLVSTLSGQFNVSREAAGYRLAELRILNDQRSNKQFFGTTKGSSLLGWLRDAV